MSCVLLVACSSVDALFIGTAEYMGLELVSGMFHR
jgi:hypothetical protein